MFCIKPPPNSPTLVTLALRALGLNIMSYEYDDDCVNQDILSPSGFAFALALLLRARPGSVVWFAIVCSTWVWVSRYSTGRSAWNPLGRRTKATVEANFMMARVLLLFRLSHALGHFTILEQPTSSILEDTGRFEDMRRDIATVHGVSMIAMDPMDGVVFVWALCNLSGAIQRQTCGIVGASWGTIPKQLKPLRVYSGLVLEVLLWRAVVLFMGLRPCSVARTLSIS